MYVYCEVNGGNGTPGAVTAYFDDISMSIGGGSVGSPIHSIADYQTLDSNNLPVRFLMIGAGTGVWSLNLQTLVLTQVGTLPTSDRWGTFNANGQLHIGTKAGVWFWDGIKLRKNGIRALTTAEASAITVSIGAAYPDVTGVSAAFTTGGLWASSDLIGELVYAAIFDPSTSSLSPFIEIGASRVQGAAGQKLVISGLPSLTGGKLWIPGITADGSSAAAFLSARGSAHAPTALPAMVAGVFSGSLLTIQSTSHGLSTGDVVLGTIGLHISAHSVSINVLNNFGPMAVTVIDANHYSIPISGDPSTTTVTSYSAYQVLTGGTVSDGAYRIPGLALNTKAGIPATSVQSAQPGYQLYCSIWNPVTGHVGNRVAIGGRLAPPTPCTAFINNLPILTSEDPEFEILIGSTVDGGEVPYALMDANGNWLSVRSGYISNTFDGTYELDFESELPSRNGVPVPMDRFCTIGDWVLGATGTDTLVRVSGSATAALSPTVLGRPEQSWAPTDALMFPFRETILNMWETGNDCIVMSGPHMARLVYAQGIWDWAETFPMGVAGQRAFTHTDKGPYWVNFKKKLATIGSAGPMEVSGEYERALLSKIGSKYMNDVTLMHLHNVDKYQDQVIIKARDANGNPFEVVHDFNLSGQQSYSMSQTAGGKRVYSNDVASTGQGYIRQYAGPLASDYVMADCEDVDGFSRCYLGGSDGNVYIGQEGWNDAGTEYSADYIGLSNLGPDRPTIVDVDLWGDTDILNQDVFSWRKDLDGSSDWSAVASIQHRAEEHDMHFHHQFSPGDLHMFYYRFQLNSHSADAPAVELSDPPHLPLEGYGKIYMARALYSDVPRGQ
jgi:hypothetical protein